MKKHSLEAAVFQRSKLWNDKFRIFCRICVRADYNLFSNSV